MPDKKHRRVWSYREASPVLRGKIRVRYGSNPPDTVFDERGQATEGVYMIVVNGKLQYAPRKE